MVLTLVREGRSRRLLLDVPGLPATAGQLRAAVAERLRVPLGAVGGVSFGGDALGDGERLVDAGAVASPEDAASGGLAAAASVTSAAASSFSAGGGGGGGGGITPATAEGRLFSNLAAAAAAPSPSSSSGTAAAAATAAGAARAYARVRDPTFPPLRAADYSIGLGWAAALLLLLALVNSLLQ